MSEPLPNRRTGLTREFTWQHKHVVSVTVNFAGDIDAQVCEIFIKGIKEHSELGAYANDLGIMISLALQHGIPLPKLARTLGADAPDPSMGAMAYQVPIGLISEAVAI